MAKLDLPCEFQFPKSVTLKNESSRANFVDYQSVLGRKRCLKMYRGECNFNSQHVFSQIFFQISPRAQEIHSHFQFPLAHSRFTVIFNFPSRTVDSQSFSISSRFTVIFNFPPRTVYSQSFSISPHAQ